METVIGALVGGAVALPGVWLGFWLSRRQQRIDAVQAERERRLMQMQQLVVAAAELITARKIYQVTWMSRTTRWRMGGMAAIEFWSAWQARESTWNAAVVALAPSARVVHDWNRRSVEEAATLAPHMARVAAAGLPLGMADDPALAEAAQKLMDACLEDHGESAITEAVAGLRAVFYGTATPALALPPAN